MKSLIPLENIQQFIYLIRGQKVMLSTHLSGLYGVEPRALVQAVRRNRDRFPDDFMFQLTGEEFQNLKSQIVISSWGGLRRAAGRLDLVSGTIRSSRTCLPSPCPFGQGEGHNLCRLDFH